ncbi:MAG: hypothetical protein B7Z15_23510 [Rhizobiales bacterium 32-66-8]|nr:MAG: hypothetical protein B7Z15_23510 [Rhizobiales bacterium 32-66-8]
MRLAQIVDHHLRPQPVHFHPLEKVIGDGEVHVEPERVFGIAGEALGQDLALRRQQRPPGGNATGFGGDGAGHHIVEQLMRVGPRKAEHDTVGAQMDGHGHLPLGRGVR